MVPHGDNFSYSASKAAIHMMARHMAHNVTRHNITINSIAPGPFRSKMMGYMLDDPDSRARVAKAVPLKRIGTPEDVAGAVIYLSSRAGAFLTGVVIPVDGGLSTHG
jgi:NAD(P)-dependent dehydrogenase (short-subunit alcohol dehydrogenase family)